MHTISRRGFLKRSALLGAGAISWGVLPRRLCAQQAAGNGTKVLFVNLNGGLDGLYALQPGTGSLYSTLASLRPTLATNPAALLPARYGFGFHPNLTHLKTLFDSGELSAVLGVGYKNMSRSHLDSEVVMARGAPDRLGSGSSGFLTRLGSYYQWSNMRAVSVSGSDLAFEGGAYRGLQVGSLESFYFRNFASAQERTHLSGVAYSMADIASANQEKARIVEGAENLKIAVDSIDVVKAAVQQHSPSVMYPNTRLGQAFKDIDTLFTAPEIDTQVGYIRRIGFDTHSNQAMNLDPLLSELNAALAAFTTSMKQKGLWQNLIVLVYSEFGRTTPENGSGGTDHGGGNTVLLLGGAVQGGDIFGELSVTDLTAAGWLDMKFNVVEVYRRIITRMGLDPDAIFAASDGPALNALFT